MRSTLSSITLHFLHLRLETDLLDQFQLFWLIQEFGLIHHIMFLMMWAQSERK